MAPTFKSVWGRVFTVPNLRSAYNRTFRSPPGAEYVLPDIAEFCAAQGYCPDNMDLFKLGRRTGRQDVWQHIQELLFLTEEELQDIYKARSIVRPEDFDPKPR